MNLAAIIATKTLQYLLSLPMVRNRITAVEFYENGNIKRIEL